MWRPLQAAVLLASLVLAATGGFAPAAILDPEARGEERDLLAELAEPLERAGIDVILGAAADFPPAARPRAASLSGYVPRERDWASFLQGAWVEAFDEGVVGAVLGVRNAGQVSPAERQKLQCEQDLAIRATAECDFILEWLAAPSENKVFVAFTRSDFEHAAAIRAALEERGFLVFTYLKDAAGAPWADPDVVGELFAQSAHRLVVDSVAARGSAGVAFEAHCCAHLLVGPRPPSTSPLMSLLQPSP